MIYPILRRLLFSLEPELAHDLVLGGLSLVKPFLKRLAEGRKAGEKVRVWGLEFGGVIGVAAGLDKNAVLGSLWSAFGFSFVEVGTITPLPQRGNPKPRLFRLEGEMAILNRMGFNNEGVERVRERLLKDPHVVPIGINAGKNKDTPNDVAFRDYITVMEHLYDLGDYFVVNVSSPNTQGLRELQKGDHLERTLGEIYRWRKGKRPRKPLLIKLAPELKPEELEFIAGVCERNDVDGVILTNTLKVEGGGLSGKPLFRISTEKISEWRRVSSLPVIGVGGIFSLSDAREKLRRGAVLTQALTGFIYRGWEIFR